jgi:hypothetical protein
MALRNKSRSIRRHSNKNLKSTYCCLSAYQTKKLPHVWYMHHSIIYKSYYCPKHAEEMQQDAFKTKKQLLAHLVTETLLC